MINKKPFVEWVLHGIHQNLIYWLFPTVASEQILRAIWDAASWAAILISPQIKLNSQLSSRTSFFSRQAKHPTHEIRQRATAKIEKVEGRNNKSRNWWHGKATENKKLWQRPKLVLWEDHKTDRPQVRFLKIKKRASKYEKCQAWNKMVNNPLNRCLTSTASTERQVSPPSDQPKNEPDNTEYWRGVEGKWSALWWGGSWRKHCGEQFPQI